MTPETHPALLELDAALCGTDASRAVNAAAQLMGSGAYVEAMRGYQEVAARFPDELATCLFQVGTAHLQLGEAKRALGFYQAAFRYGADEELLLSCISTAQHDAAMATEVDMSELTRPAVQRAWPVPRAVAIAVAAALAVTVGLASLWPSAAPVAHTQSVPMPPTSAAPTVVTPVDVRPHGERATAPTGVKHKKANRQKRVRHPSSATARSGAPHHHA